MPLFEQSAKLCRAIICALDAAAAEKGLTGREIKLVDALICSLADSLSDEDFGEAQQAILVRQGGTVSQAAPPSLDNVAIDHAGAGESLAQIQAQVDAMQAQLDADAAARLAQRSGRQKAQRKPARNSAAKQQAQQASLSVREVYRKLASILHPDRAGDPHEALQKTQLMQRANEAYAKQDLLGLLSLQLAVAQVDQASLSNVGELRLTHYNQVLAEQVNELTREIRHVEAEFRRQFGIPSSVGLAPGKLLRLLTKDVVAMQQAVFQYKNDLLACGSSDKLKAWLKQL